MASLDPSKGGDVVSASSSQTCSSTKPYGTLQVYRTDNCDRPIRSSCSGRINTGTGYVIECSDLCSHQSAHIRPGTGQNTRPGTSQEHVPDI